MSRFAGLLAENGDDLLNQLGVNFPLTSYDSLRGANACVVFGSRYLRLVDVPAVAGHERSVLLYVRSTADDVSGPSATPAPVATPQPSAIGSSEGNPEVTYADFAPPLFTVADYTSSSSSQIGLITIVPTKFIQLTAQQWSRTFIAAVAPMPGGRTMYRFPDAEGNPLYTADNPFVRSGTIVNGIDPDKVGQDPLAFVGLAQDGSLSRIDQLAVFLMTVINTSSGSVTYYWDGAWFDCSWTDGLSAQPSRGQPRQQVKLACDHAKP